MNWRQERPSDILTCMSGIWSALAKFIVFGLTRRFPCLLSPCVGQFDHSSGAQVCISPNEWIVSTRGKGKATNPESATAGWTVLARTLVVLLMMIPIWPSAWVTVPTTGLQQQRAVQRGKTTSLLHAFRKDDLHRFGAHFVPSMQKGNM